MKINFSVSGLCAVVMVAVLLFGEKQLSACGLDWKKPHFHFNDVDRHGHINYVEKVGDMDLGGDKPEAWPLFIRFNSSWSENSPYLGKGWMLPMLESRITQIDENAFKLWLPNGYQETLKRNKNYPDILHAPGWKAVIKGDTISAWTSCGWRLTYEKGKITQIGTPDNRVFSYDYLNRKVVDIRSASKILLKVNYDSASGAVNGLEIGDKRIAIEEGKKPSVQNINGQNVVAAIDNSLSKITFSDGSSKAYEFAVNKQLQPTLKIGGSVMDRVITWDAISKNIVSDNDWTYKIVPHDKANAEIGRTNPQGQGEYWFVDARNGTQVVQGVDGIRKTVTSFTTGILRGRTRDEEWTKNGVTIKKYHASYDEAGHLLRSIWESNDKRTEETFDYDSMGNCLAAYRDGKKEWTHIWEKGTLKTVILADGTVTNFATDKSGILKQVLEKNSQPAAKQ